MGGKNLESMVRRRPNYLANNKDNWDGNVDDAQDVVAVYDLGTRPVSGDPKVGAPNV